MLSPLVCQRAAKYPLSTIRLLSSHTLATTRIAERRTVRLHSIYTYAKEAHYARQTAWPSPRSPFRQVLTPNRIQCRYYADVIIKVPEMAESISEGTLKQWSKRLGDHVEQDEEIATIETDKIDVSVNAPAAGTLKQFMANEEDTVSVGQEIAKMDSGAAPEEGRKSSATSEPKAPASDEQKTTSQPDGTKEKEAPNEQAEQKTRRDEKPDIQPPQRAPQPKQDQTQQQERSREGDHIQQQTDSRSGNREERRVKMNRMRLRIAERLKQSQNTAASLTTFQKVDMSALMEFRKKYKEEVLKKTGVKLGFMSAFTRASILAMKDIPSVNASIEGPDGGDTVVYRDYVDVSVAVATEKGLVTPVVRNAETMDLIGIEKAIAELGKKARDNKLTIEDMAGGTYTISNGGVFGSLFGTPIINLPQTAVLGLHAINDEAVVVNGKIEARPIMYLALTYDHRLLDGREAVLFLKSVKTNIEDPARMLLG